MRLPAQNHFSIKQLENGTNELTIEAQTGISVHRARPTSIFFKPSLAFFSLSTTFFALAAACTCKFVHKPLHIHDEPRTGTRIVHCISTMNVSASHQLGPRPKSESYNLRCCGSCFTTVPLYLAGCLHGRGSGSALHQTC